MTLHILLPLLVSIAPVAAQERRVVLAPATIRSSSPLADFSGLADEQENLGDPPSAAPKRGWEVPSQHWKKFPFAAEIDLGRQRNLASLWIYDTFGQGEFSLSTGEPGRWKPLFVHRCDLFQRWTRLPLDVTTRWLRIELKDPGANLAEIAVYEYTPEAHRAMLARKEADAAQRQQRDAALQQARAQRERQPWFDLPPFGRVRVVDEIDCGSTDPGHQFRQSPPQASRVETILGRACRVLSTAPDPKEASYMAFRLGKWKLLRPGAPYVLAVEYPEDRARSVLVMCGGNESSRGFHTGTTVGDALHPKYVNNNPESLRVPLSGRFEQWTLFFNLHDRFPDLAFLRGEGQRKLTAEDGFDVAITQFPPGNDPTSAGAAVARIRLLELADPGAMELAVRWPKDLPRRKIFWREEMADGVIQSDKPTHRGLANRLDWYRFKAQQMKALGIPVFSKDLLEFGACQHWDSTPYGGNAWVHFAHGAKDLWPQIVEMMGRQGFSILPYYEYAGSKGDRGLGYQRRAKPLTRDDAYTHISWVESANADLTDPDTYADFRKMLDLTVLRLKDKARFEGIWLRPRWQLPMSFADATRERFSNEANQGRPVTRAELIADKALLDRYVGWWYGKRREFLAAMRDYLRQGGVPEAIVLFTAEGGEPGPSFPTWEPRVVTDDVSAWKAILAGPEHLVGGRRMTPLALDRVVSERLYLEALLAGPMDWGKWEVNHANPPPDPSRYRDAEGLLLTHAFNRRYTVDAPQTLEAFRGPAGLALVRHYTLNENMLFDAKDQPKLGYFVCDVERAGPYSMMAEALAVARGDPTHLGYLTGGTFGRGFPQHVRRFNAAFLALPALPSRLAPEACADQEVVVRAIRPQGGSTYLAVVNTSYQPKSGVRLRLPAPRALDAATGAPLAVQDHAATLDLAPFELKAIEVP